MASFSLWVGFLATAAMVCAIQAQCDIGTCLRMVPYINSMRYPCTTINDAVTCLQAILGNYVCHRGTRESAERQLRNLWPDTNRCYDRETTVRPVPESCDVDRCKNKVNRNYGVEVFCRTVNEAVACLQTIAGNYACDANTKRNAATQANILWDDNRHCLQGTTANSVPEICDVERCKSKVSFRNGQTGFCRSVNEAVTCLQTMSRNYACDRSTQSVAIRETNVLSSRYSNCLGDMTVQDVQESCDVDRCMKKVIKTNGLQELCRTVREAVACLHTISNENTPCDKDTQINARTKYLHHSSLNSRCFKEKNCETVLAGDTYEVRLDSKTCSRNCSAPTPGTSSNSEYCRRLREFQECNYRDFDNFGPCLSFDMFYINDIFARIQCTQATMRAARCPDECEVTCTAPEIYSDKSAQTCSILADHVSCLRRSAINNPICPYTYKSRLQTLVSRYRTLVPGCQGEFYASIQ